MDRAPGLSVRLKLTLSYAGFLMIAGALLLAVVWVFLLRYVPDRLVLAPGPFIPHIPDRTDLLRAFVPRAAEHVGVPARVQSRGRVASRRLDARPSDSHHGGHAHGRDRIALPPNPATGAQR